MRSLARSACRAQKRLGRNFCIFLPFKRSLPFDWLYWTSTSFAQKAIFCRSRLRKVLEQTKKAKKENHWSKLWAVKPITVGEIRLRENEKDCTRVHFGISYRTPAWLLAWRRILQSQWYTSWRVQVRANNCWLLVREYNSFTSLNFNSNTLSGFRKVHVTSSRKDVLKGV